MKILVIDNDSIIRQSLVSMILEEMHESVQIEEAIGVISGKEKIDSFKPDVVFLDVEMDDGTGFDLMNQIPSPTFQLVFVTAFNKYAVHAFRFSAIDFLLKPIDRMEFRETMSRVSEKLHQNDLISQLGILKDSINKLSNPDQKIVLKDSKSLYFIRVSDILYCAAENAYTIFHLEDGNQIVVTKNLKEYQQLLEPLNFIRPHHSFLVNTSKILRLDKTDGGSLVLENNQNIPISQRKFEQIMRQLGNR